MDATPKKYAGVVRMGRPDEIEWATSDLKAEEQMKGERRYV